MRKFLSLLLLTCVSSANAAVLVTVDTTLLYQPTLENPTDPYKLDGANARFEFIYPSASVDRSTNCSGDINTLCDFPVTAINSANVQFLSRPDDANDLSLAFLMERPLHTNFDGAEGNTWRLSGSGILPDDTLEALGVSFIWQSTEVLSAPTPWAPEDYDNFRRFVGSPGFGNDDFRWDVVDVSFTAEEVVIPIPTAFWLFGSALALLGWLKRER